MSPAAIFIIIAVVIFGVILGVMIWAVVEKDKDSCSIPSDCKDPNKPYCVNSKCVPRCTSDDQCSAGQVCVNGACTSPSDTSPTTTDPPENVGGCVTHADCSNSEEFCIEGQCVEPACDTTACNDEMKDLVITKYWKFNEDGTARGQAVKCRGCAIRGFKVDSAFVDDKWVACTGRTPCYNRLKLQPVSQDGRCGPDHGNARCPDNQCCSNQGWCGTSVHCNEGHRLTGSDKYLYDGPNTAA